MGPQATNLVLLTIDDEESVRSSVAAFFEDCGFTVLQACDVVGFSVLTEAVAQLGAALVRIATGLALLAVGLWLATLAAASILASDLPRASALALAARSAVLFLACALALRQMGLPAEIVAMAFGSVVLALAVAFALAFGLGGRRVAALLLQRAVDAFSAGSRVPAAPSPPGADVASR